MLSLKEVRPEVNQLEIYLPPLLVPLSGSSLHLDPHPKP